MAKALIVYGSTTGNTESVAHQVSEILSRQGLEVTIKDVAEAKIEELGENYEVTILGSSTWGDDEIEFQEDFASFYEEMGHADLTGRKVAIFGCGDSSYEFFCGAVDLLQEKVGDLGGLIINEPLRIDGDPQDVTAEITDWANDIALSV